MTLRIALAQDNFLVGGIPENAQKVRLLAQQAKAQQSDIIVFPELCLTGYPQKKEKKIKTKNKKKKES